jgi:hypothetical protein
MRENTESMSGVSSNYQYPTQEGAIVVNPNSFLVIFCLTIVLGLMSFGCQIYVSRQLSKAGAKVSIPLGKRSWITPFVQGWQNSKQLAIGDVMIFWSIILGLTFLGMIVTVFALLALNPVNSTR